MPCSDGGPDPRTETLRQQQSMTVAAQRSEARMRSLLCSACTALEAQGFNFALNPLLDEWWTDHKAHDAAKAAEQAQRELAARLAGERVLSLSNTKLIDMTEDDKAFLRKHGVL